MTAVLQFYVIDNLWEGRLSTSHFHYLADAVRAYRELPAANRKALGVQYGVDAIDLVQCLPLSSSQAPHPSLPGDARKLTRCAAPPLPTKTTSLGSRGGPIPDREGKDVMALRFLEFPLWKSEPQVMDAAQELASRLHIRYCLFRRCIIPVPVRDKLPRALRGRYLWPDEPGDFYTAAQWVYVAGEGRLSAAEFKRRFHTVQDAVHYPLVTQISACGMDGRGNYKALQVNPWEFHLLAHRSQERLDQNKKEMRNLK